MERNDIYMTQEDRRLMLESLYDVRRLEVPSDISMDTIAIGTTRQNLFKDKMQKQVERTLKLYEESHPDVIPFKMLACENWLLDIEKDGGISLTKKLGGTISQSLHAYDDTGKFYYYTNITVGLAVHDFTHSDSSTSYYWYFLLGKNIDKRHELYYRLSAYYSEYGVSQYLLKYLGELSKM